MRKLPPLNALRAFEAAGRHLSFTRAAAELHVTQAAVSQQIKLLEDYLKQPLFVRDGRTLLLAEGGDVFLRQTTAALDGIALAARQFMDTSAEQTLVITTLSSFAGAWLLPRLAGFQREHPDIRVRIDTGNQMVDLKHADVHGAIRYGAGQYAGLESELLFDETVFPVCSPELWRSLGQSSGIEILDRAVLIYDVEAPNQWQQWLEIAGHPERRPTLSLAFNESQLMIKAAEDNMGIALGRRELVAPGLEAGRLVAPFGEKMQSQLAYYWVTDPVRADYQPLHCFRAWLMLECKRYVEHAQLSS